MTKEQVDALIAKYDGWVPSDTLLFPGAIGGDTELGDVAAVIAGSKPCAMVVEAGSKSPGLQASPREGIADMLQCAIKSGCHIIRRECPDPGRRGLVQAFVSRHPEVCEQAAAAWIKTFDAVPDVQDEGHTGLGIALGYGEERVQKWVMANRDRQNQDRQNQVSGQSN